MKKKYYIETYDHEQEKFTPQKGVRKGPYSLFGLRKAIRKLREFGYPCDYHYCGHFTTGDPSVSIYAVEK